MNRRPKELQKALIPHLFFVVIMTFGAMINAAVNSDNSDVTIFGSVFVFVLIVASSILNQFTIQTLKEYNSKWPVLNYCGPAMALIALILILQIPVDGFNLLFFTILMLIANLINYSLTGRDSRARIR